MNTSNHAPAPASRPPPRRRSGLSAFRVIGFGLSERVVAGMSVGRMRIQDVDAMPLDAVVGEGVIISRAARWNLSARPVPAHVLGYTRVEWEDSVTMGTLLLLDFVGDYREW